MDESRKRTASQAELASNDIQVFVQIPPDASTGGQKLALRLRISATDRVDDLKRAVQQGIFSKTGMCPRLNCFRLMQHNLHVPFYASVSALDTRAPVSFERTWAE